MSRSQKRWGMIAIGVFATLSIMAAALYKQGALYAISIMSTYFIAIAPAVLGSFYWKSSTKEGALLSVSVAGLVGTYWVFLPFSTNVIHPMWVTSVLSTAIFVIVSLFITHVYPGQRISSDGLKGTRAVSVPDFDLNRAAGQTLIQDGERR